MNVRTPTTRSVGVLCAWRDRKKRPAWRAAALVLTVLLAACTPLAPRPTPAAPSQPAASGATLRLGCPPLGTAEAQYCFAVREILASALPGVPVSALPSGPPREQLARLALGELDLAWVRQDLTYAARYGQGPGDGRPSHDVHLLWLYAVQPLLIAIRADSGITTRAQLSNAPFAPGLPESETAELTRTVLGALDSNPRYVALGLDDTITAVQAGAIVGFAKLARTLHKPDGLVAYVERTTPLRILGLAAPERAHVQRQHPEITWAGVPAHIYERTMSSGALTTAAYAFGFAARLGLPDDVAYAITRAIVEDSAAGRNSRQASAYPDVKDTDLALLTAAVANVPLHPGAARAYRERGLALPPAAIPGASRLAR